MPSHLGICYGQRGRMEVEIDTTGVSAHGSQPERGRNAIYEMMPIIDGLKELHEGLEIDHAMLGRGSLAVTGISSQSPSLTAVPDGCTIHVDRRLTIGETAEDAQAQLEQVAEVAGENASVRLLHYDLPSWRGFTYPTDKVFPAWETALESPAIQSALSAAECVLGRSRVSTGRPFLPTAARRRGCSTSRPSASARRTSSTLTPSTTRSRLPSSNRPWPSMGCIRRCFCRTAEPNSIFRSGACRRRGRSATVSIEVAGRARSVLASRAGIATRAKPRAAASRTLSAARLTARTSPSSPTSPKMAMSGAADDRPRRTGGPPPPRGRAPVPVRTARRPG